MVRCHCSGVFVVGGGKGAGCWYARIEYHDITVPTTLYDLDLGKCVASMIQSLDSEDIISN